ncbi:hypothetical protein BBJ28_00008527 [Nothophytophthora sp. Chile5]|nr:hypothetical protein BBJ28_00008527 [Nothophytophthora sp. Chile5]
MTRALIYRTMVPLFATTTVVPFDDVVSVAQTTSFGIQVVAVVLDPAKHPKGMTIAMGLEVDLLYQLLSEISSMHKREAKEAVTARNAVELEKILSSEKEEEKEDEGLASVAAPASTSDSKVAGGGTSAEQEGGNA